MEEAFRLEGGAAVSSSSSSSLEGSPDPATPVKGGIDLCRRVVVSLIETSEDCCSICLDEYTASDPGVPTMCGHSYHLQCVMQWAQRSRECPLCFQTLQLKDESMNELLPFGEYISPEQQAMGLVNMESWELERLLLRLAAANQRQERRVHRHRHQPSRGEPSAPQPIVGAPGQQAGASRRTDPGSAAAAGVMSDDESTGRRPSSSPGAYPSSWPPAAAPPEAAGSSRQSSGLFGSSVGDHGSAASPSSRGGSSLKSKFASLRLKESFSKTTRELKSLFSPSGGSRPDGGGGSSTAG